VSSRASGGAALDTVFPISAGRRKWAGWSNARMRRHLEAKKAELGGTLLYNVSRGKRPASVDDHARRLAGDRASVVS
jgi:hypothetical protein